MNQLVGGIVYLLGKPGPAESPTLLPGSATLHGSMKTTDGAETRNQASGHTEAPVIAEPRELFRHLAHWTAEAAGSVWVFAGALVLILAWLVTGPIFRYSDAWQLVINTTTTIVTFLMVFLIQNTQNRDARAIHLKLDELIRAGKARDLFMNLEELTDAELKTLAANLALAKEQSVQKLAARAEARRKAEASMSRD